MRHTANNLLHGVLERRGGDALREKRLELVNGMHVLGINSLLAISLVYPYIRNLSHSTTTSYSVA
jgi:hypothetical protein